MVINQWLPAAHKGDAVGDSARRVKALLRSQGHTADIFALTIDEPLRGHIREFSDPDARRGDITILHYAVPSRMSEALAQLPQGTRAAVSQRDTSPLFCPVRSPHLPNGHDRAPGAREPGRPGRPCAGRLRVQPVKSWLSSASTTPASCRSSSSHGAGRAGVDHPALERVLNDELTNILFVGRVAPNKRLEDHLRLAEHYKRYVDAGLSVHFRWPHRRRAPLLRNPSRTDAGVRDGSGPISVSRSCLRCGSGRLLPKRACVSVVE